MKTISLLSLNCFDISLFTIAFRKPRLKKIAEAIVEQEADIVCLQEVIFPDAMRLMRESLLAHGYTVFPEESHDFFNPGGLMTATRLDVNKASFTKFTDQGRVFALDIFERLTVKGYHRIILRPDPHQSQITFINTHLHCPFGAYFSNTIPAVTASQYRQIVSNEHPRSQCILAGDLNITPTNRLYGEITKTFCDPQSGDPSVTVTGTNTHRRFLHKLRARIDYILVTPDLAPHAQSHVVFQQPVRLSDGSKHHLSDHFGVWTKISI